MPATRTLNRTTSRTENDDVKSSSPVSSIDKMNAAKEYSDSTGSNADDVKYKMAVESARNNLKDQENAGERELKSEIDSELKKLGASKSGSELRGETAFTQALDGARGFIDDATLAGGNAIDWVFDNTLGNLTGAVLGEDAGNSIKDLMDGKDLQGAVDVASDIGLSLLGPAGWAAMVGKNAIQQSGNIMDAFAGKDRVTREEFDGGEVAANLVEGLGGVALSAVPVVGKMRNLGKAADLAKNAVKNTVQGPVLKEAGSKGIDAMIKPQVDDAMKAIRKPLRGPAVDDYIAIRTESNMPKAKAPKYAKATEDAPKHAKETASIRKKISEKVPNAIKRIPSGIAGAGAGTTTAGMATFLPSIASGDADMDQLSQQELAPLALTGMTAMLGGKHRVSPNGKIGGIGSLIPAAALAAAGSAKQTDRMYEKKKRDGMTDEEIMASLRVR